HGKPVPNPQRAVLRYRRGTGFSPAPHGEHSAVIDDMSVVTELARPARPARAEKGAPTRRPLRRGDGRSAALFLAPWFLGLGLITIGPMVASRYLSFTDYSLLAPPKWIGLENYTRMFEDPRLLNSLRVTFTYVFSAVPLSLVAPPALAPPLLQRPRGTR